MSKSKTKKAESPEGPTQAANCELASQNIKVIKVYKNNNTLVNIIPYEQYALFAEHANFKFNLQRYRTVELITLKEYETYKTLFGEH